jgi:hypothetical protein
MTPLLVAPFLGLLLTPFAWTAAAALTEFAVVRRGARAAAYRRELADIDTWLDAIRRSA